MKRSQATLQKLNEDLEQRASACSTELKRSYEESMLQKLLTPEKVELLLQFNILRQQ